MMKARIRAQSNVYYEHGDRVESDKKHHLCIKKAVETRRVIPHYITKLILYFVKTRYESNTPSSDVSGSQSEVLSGAVE